MLHGLTGQNKVFFVGDAIKVIHKITFDVKIHETARENSYFISCFKK